MRTKLFIMAFVALAVIGTLNLAFAFPFFVLQRPGGSLVVVDSRPTYSDSTVAGPYGSMAEAQSALQSLVQLGNAAGILPLRERRERTAATTPNRVATPRTLPTPEGPLTLSSLGTSSAAANAPLATLPFGDFSGLLANDEFAFGSPLYSTVPPYPELSSFQLSQFPLAVGPSPLLPIPLSQTTVNSIPRLPQPNFSVPQIQVPLTVPGIPGTAFTSPLPLAIGYR